MKCVGGQLFRWVGSDGREGDRSRAHTGLLVPAQARAGSASRKQNPALPATSPRASGVEPQPSSNGPTGHDRSTAGADVRELMSNRKKSSKSTPGQMRSAECAGAGKPGQQPDETGELNMARWAFDPTDEVELNMARVALVVRLQKATLSTLQSATDLTKKITDVIDGDEVPDTIARARIPDRLKMISVAVQERLGLITELDDVKAETWADLSEKGERAITQCSAYDKELLTLCVVFFSPLACISSGFLILLKQCCCSFLSGSAATWGKRHALVSCRTASLRRRWRASRQMAANAMRERFFYG